MVPYISRAGLVALALILTSRTALSSTSTIVMEETSVAMEPTTTTTMAPATTTTDGSNGNANTATDTAMSTEAPATITDAGNVDVTTVDVSGGNTTDSDDPNIAPTDGADSGVSGATDALGATADPSATDAPEATDAGATDDPSATEAPEDGATDSGDSMTTAPSGNRPSATDSVTSTNDGSPDVTTSSSAISCYECSGVGCDVVRTNQHRTCTSTLGICFLSFDLTNGTMAGTTRSCNSTLEYKMSCGSVYPSGTYADNTCEYCCTTNNCNSISLVASTCESIRDSGASGRHRGNAVVYVTSVMAVLIGLVRSLAD